MVKDFPLPKNVLIKDLLLNINNFNLPGAEVFWNINVPYKYFGKVEYSLVDIVLTSLYGIYIFEVRDYDATLNGDIYDFFWHGFFSNNECCDIYNPIIENETNKKRLAKYLHIRKSKIVTAYLLKSNDINVDLKNENVFFEKDSYSEQIYNFLSSKKKEILKPHQLTVINELLYKAMSTTTDK